MQNETFKTTGGKFIWAVFLGLVFLSVVSPVFVYSSFLFPFVTSKAFFFRFAIEAGLPFYFFLILGHRGLRPNWKNPASLSLISFLIISAVCGALGVNPVRSLWGNYERMGGVFYLAHLVLFYFYLLLITKVSDKWSARFLNFFLGVAALLSLNGLLGKLGGPMLSIDTSLPERVSSVFGNPIFFASYLVVPFCLSLYLGMKNLKSRLVYAYAGLALLFLWGIWASGTRGALIGIFTGLIVGLGVWAAIKYRPRKIYYAAPVAVVLLAIFFVMRANQNLNSGYTQRSVFTFSDANSRSRLIQWSVALKGFSKKPFLGVGPENYNYIANLYNNPAINQYDATWFDKPHNYYLEVLTTTGLVGSAAYGAILVSAFWGLKKSYEQKYLSRVETAILSGGLAAYLVQNIFVFDTISASIAFFVLLYVCGKAWEKKVGELGDVRPAAWPAFFVFLLLAAYSAYAYNVLPIQASRDINIGFSYSSSDPKLAEEYFERAIANPGGFDVVAAANRYSEFLDYLLQSDLSEKEPDYVIDKIRKATEFQREASRRSPNDPLVWLRLAEDEAMLALATRQPLADSVNIPAQRAMDLAPNRVEPWLLRAKIKTYINDWESASVDFEKILKLNPYYSIYKMQAAQTFSHAPGRMEAAAGLVQGLIAEGYKFRSENDFIWLADYYKSKKQYPDLVKIYELAINYNPGNLTYYLELIKANMRAGDPGKAKLLSDFLVTQNPALKNELSKLLNQIK